MRNRRFDGFLLLLFSTLETLLRSRPIKTSELFLVLNKLMGGEKASSSQEFFQLRSHFTSSAAAPCKLQSPPLPVCRRIPWCTGTPSPPLLVIAISRPHPGRSSGNTFSERRCLPPSSSPTTSRAQTAGTSSATHGDATLEC